MYLVIDARGTVRAIYCEEIDLATLGRPAIVRASHVEPDRDGRWHADLRPMLGPVLGPFGRRSKALEAERAWLEAHWLMPMAGTVRTSPAAPLSGPHAGDVPDLCPWNR